MTPYAANQRKQGDMGNAANLFIRGVIHELTGPLTAVAELSKLHLSNERHSSRYFELLTDISSSTSNAVSLVRALSALLTEMDSTERPESIHVMQQAQLIINEIQITKGAFPTFVIKPMAEIVTERGMFHLILSNLIRNACKFSAASSDPKIEIGSTEDDEESIFYVADNGVGISEKYRRSLFQPFSRLHGSEYPGVGIGLYLCRLAVERLGGHIWYESPQSGGCVFLFSLPKAG